MLHELKLRSQIQALTRAYALLVIIFDAVALLAKTVINPNQHQYTTSYMILPCNSSEYQLLCSPGYPPPSCL
jgi:hypothetical protein